MPDWFNPQAPVGLPAQQDDLRRQQQIVQFLRQQALNVPQAKGSMVGKVYFNPTLAETLPGAIDAGASLWADKNLANSTNQYNQNVDTARQSWQSSLPQATAARPELPGPVDPNNPNELAAQPAQPVTTAQVLKATLQGMAIPGNEKSAEMYQRGALADITREDNQAAIKEQRAADQAAALIRQREQLQARAEELRIRMEDRGLDRASREAFQKMHDETLRAIAAGNLELRRLAIEAKANKVDAPKPLPSTVMKTLTSLETQAEALGNVASSFKPEYGGWSGKLDKISGTWNPMSGKSSEEVANWWKNYENQAALVERHEKFGTALSAGEQTAWQNATIAPGMKPDVIKKNLDTRAKIANTLYERARMQHIKAGYPLVKDAFQGRSPRQTIDGKSYVNIGGQWFEE